MAIAREPFGDIADTPIEALTLTNAAGMRARLITYGARLTELHLPDRHGATADVVIGFDDVARFADVGRYVGATCGRYGNRIAGGRFALMGREVQVDVNEPPNHLHGGTGGFDRKVWAAETEEAANRVVFSAVSADGECGFPGRCELRATYQLTDAGELRIVMEADADRATPMNMVNHAYFNLAGHAAGDVRGHLVQLHADFYTPVDAQLLTTGEVLSVAGTAFDFRAPRRLGDGFDALAPGGRGGFDHNWCLRGASDVLHPCADIREPVSGRGLTLATTEPGVQFYTAGHFGPSIIGKGGSPYRQYAGFTLETQTFPDTPNKAHFPNCILRAGDHYRHEMLFRFSAE